MPLSLTVEQVEVSYMTFLKIRRLKRGLIASEAEMYTNANKQLKHSQMYRKISLHTNAMDIKKILA